MGLLKCWKSLRELKIEEKLTIKQCSELLGMTYDAAKHHIKQLLKQGLVEKEGQRDACFWVSEGGQSGLK